MTGGVRSLPYRRARCHPRGDGGHRRRRRARPGCWRRLRGLQQRRGRSPLSGIALVTGFFSVVGVVPPPLFCSAGALAPPSGSCGTAVTLAAISLVPPVAPRRRAPATATALVGLHVDCGDGDDPDPGAEPSRLAHLAGARSCRRGRVPPDVAPIPDARGGRPTRGERAGRPRPSSSRSSLGPAGSGARAGMQTKPDAAGSRSWSGIQRLIGRAGHEQGCGDRGAAVVALRPGPTRTSGPPCRGRTRRRSRSNPLTSATWAPTIDPLWQLSSREITIGQVVGRGFVTGAGRPPQPPEDGQAVKTVS